MHCSCSYVEGAKNCKRMAAVLYKWDFIKANFLADVLSNDPEMLVKYKSDTQSTVPVEAKNDYVTPGYEVHKEQGLGEKGYTYVANNARVATSNSKSQQKVKAYKVRNCDQLVSKQKDTGGSGDCLVDERDLLVKQVLMAVM